MKYISIPLVTFVDILLRNNDCVTVTSDHIAQLLRDNDRDEQFIHVQGNTIWRKSSWLADEERKRKLRIDDNVERALNGMRKHVYSVCYAKWCRLTGGDDKVSSNSLWNIITQNAAPLRELLGVEFELPSRERAIEIAKELGYEV